MKKLIIVCTMICIGLFANENDVNKMVAKVDETVITEKILMAVVNSKMSRNFLHGAVDDEKLVDLKKKTLKTLIDRELIFQYAQRNGYALNEKELLEEEKKIVAAFGSEQAFRLALARSQMSYEMFKYELEKEKAMVNVYQAKIKQEYTQEDLQRYYDENQYKFKKPESVSIQLIYVKNDPTDSNGTLKTKARIDEALGLIQSGEDFGEVATEYSDDMSRIKGGLMKNLHKGMIDPSVEDEAFSLNVGDMSKIIERTTGSYLVKVLEKHPAVQLSFDEVKLKLATELKTQREKMALDALLKKLASYSTVINTLEEH